MANLVIGDGQTRNAQHDADIYKAIFGAGTLTAQGGMLASKPDNNTIRIGSGMAICEGRVFRNDIYDDFTIPTGDAGQQTTYYLGYRIYRESSGDRIEKYIGKTKPNQGSLSGGDNQMYAILYRVIMNGINLGDPEKLCDEVPDFVSRLLTPVGEGATVTFTDNKADTQKTIQLILEKKGGVVTARANGVFNFTAASKKVTLSGAIPEVYRPKGYIGVACVLVNNAKISGSARFDIAANGTMTYVSNATGWQEVYFNAVWYT